MSRFSGGAALPRSLLYVPAHNEKMVAGASRRGADAIILDLEDSVPQAEKERARQRLGESVETAGADGAPVLVRINGNRSLAWRDLEAAAASGASGVLIPKVDSAAPVEALGEYLSELEERLELEPLAVLAIVESAAGLLGVQEIAAALARVAGERVSRKHSSGARLSGLSGDLHGRRVTGLIPGNEDLSLSLHVQPTQELMAGALWPLIIAARAQGHALFGSIGSGSDYRDLGAYRERLEFARSHGFDGATCIHPAQVEVANEVFRASAAAVEWARQAVAAFEAGNGEAVGVDGEMIDRPVYLRAKRIIDEGRE